MDKQMTISAFSDELAQVRTKKKEFLSQIERIVPWKEWLAMFSVSFLSYTITPHGFGQKTKHQISKRSKKLFGNKKSPMNIDSGHQKDTYYFGEKPK